MTTPEHWNSPADPNDGSGVSPGGPLGAMGRALVMLLRFIGLVVCIIGIVAVRVAFRQNPMVALAVGLVVLAGLALVFGAARIAQALAEDARREKPSWVIGGVKFAIGAGVAVLAIGGVTLDSRHYGLWYAAPYGWQQSIPYAVLAALGAWGVLAGGMAFLGRRPGWAVKLGVMAVVAVALGVGWPATSSVCHVRQLSTDGSARLVFSRDGSVVGLGNYSGRTAIFRVDPCEKISELPRFKRLNAMALSPDGSQCAIVDNNKLSVRQTSGGPPLFEVTLVNDELYKARLSYSDDGARLLVVAGDKFAVTCDAAGGRELSRFALPPGAIGAALSPAGQYVAAAYEAADGRVNVYVFESESAEKRSEFEVTFETPLEYGTSLSWSPNSSRLLIRANAELALFDWENGKILWQVMGRGASDLDTSAQGAMFNADGTRILATLVGGRIDIVNAADGQTTASIDQTPSWAAIWSPDGKYLVTRGLTYDTDLWDISRLEVE